MERIESERLYLRPFGHGDAEAVWAYRSLAEVARYQYWEPYTPEDARSFIERYAGQVPGEDQTWTGLAVVLKATGTVIGDCAFYLDGDRAEIGCNISPAYQRRGLAREALQTLVAYCAEVYKVALIRGITDSRATSLRSGCRSLWEWCGTGLSKTGSNARGETCTEYRFEGDCRAIFSPERTTI